MRQRRFCMSNAGSGPRSASRGAGTKKPAPQLKQFGDLFTDAVALLAARKQRDWSGSAVAPEAHKHLSAAFDRMPAGVVSSAHARALQILSQL
jgi:hypothetical protein